MNAGDGYDYVLNLSALKHVRNEKRPVHADAPGRGQHPQHDQNRGPGPGAGRAQVFLRVDRQSGQPGEHDGREQTHHGDVFDAREQSAPISTARFANVAFPMALCCTVLTSVLPSASRSRRPTMCALFRDASRVGQLCLMSCLLGENRDIFFPKRQDIRRSSPGS